MKNLIRLASILLLMSFILSGCYYDKENELFKSTAVCDTAVVTYAHSIAPIMVANCNVCHNTTLASGGIITDTYPDLSSMAAPGGMLWNAVNGFNGLELMPKNQPKLSNCDLVKINKWILAGALNN